MKPMLWLATIALVATLPSIGQTAVNPVVSVAHEIAARQSKFIIAAFEEMPAEKYTYSPTPAQQSFAKLAVHVAGSSNAVCAMLSDKPAPKTPGLTDTASKEALIAAVKESFDFCDQALTNLKDSSLGDPIIYFRGAHTSRARALFELTNDLEDHYSQMASYLRLNQLIPPSAMPRK